MGNLDAELRRLREQLKELRLQRARLQRKIQRLEPCARMLERALEERPVVSRDEGLGTTLFSAPPILTVDKRQHSPRAH